MENPTEETPPAVLETVTEEQKPVMEEEKPIVETPAPEAVQEAKVDQNPEVKAEVDVEMKEEAAKVGESTPEEAPSEVKTEESMEEPKAEEKTSEPIPEVATAATDTISAEAVKSENAETVSKVDDLPPAEPPTSMHYIKIARIPKSVFDFMVKEEPEEGTVRLNLNQLKGFVTELLNSNAHVNSAIWDTCPYPALDLTVPANTPKNCIVQNFATSNLAENEKMIAEKMQRIKEQEIARYAKMNDEQKRTAWKEVNRQYVKKDNTIQRLGAAEQKKSKKESDVPSQIKPAEPLPGGQKADSKTVSKSTSQAKIGQVDLSPAVKNDNNRKRNQTNATSGASANKKPKQDSSPQKAKMVTTPVAKKTPQQSLQQKRQSLPNTPRQQQGGAGNKSFSSKKNGGGQPLHQQQRANNRQPDNNRPKRFSDNYADRNRRSQETMAAANPWGTPNPNIFGFIAPAQDPMSGYHAYPYQSSGAMGMQSSMNPFAAAPARDPYYDAHLADRERSMLERERRLMDQNYGGHQQQQQQPQHPYSQPYGDREFRTTFDNYAAARGETPVFTRPEQPAYSTYGQDMNTSPYKNQQQPREYGRRY